MDFKIYIFSRNESKVILVGAIIGGILQIICWKYLKNNPNLLNNNNSKKLNPKKPGLFPRSGALIEITGAKLVVNVAVATIYFAKHGVLTGILLTAGGMSVKKIPINAISTAISTIVYKALPIAHSDLEKGYIFVRGKKNCFK